MPADTTTAAPGRRPQAARLLAAVLTHAPENAAYGLMAFAPLGVAFGPVAMSLALLAAVAANALASMLGGGHLVGGPRAALALLTAALIQSLLPLWQSGQAATDTALILALVAAGVALAGLLQVGYGLLRLGSLVKYMPYPVRLGLTSGIGLLLALSAWPLMTGMGLAAPGGGAVPALPHFQPWTLAVGALAAGITGLAAWRRWPVPALLAGLLAGVVLYGLLHLFWPSMALGSLAGAPSLSWGAVQFWLGGLALPADPLPWMATAELLFGYALTVSALASLDTLLATSLVDGQRRVWRDADRELVAQGLGQLAGAAAGAQPSSPSVPRSLSLLGEAAPGASSGRMGVLAYALVMLGAALAAPWVLAFLPLSALGGVLFGQGLAMVAPALLTTPWRLGRQALRRRSVVTAGPAETAPQALLWGHWVVALAVALAALLLGVGPALLIGAALAVLLFVRANLRDVVRGVWRGNERQSLKVRPAAHIQALRAQGARIALMELEGPLFFGTADALRTRLHGLSVDTERVVLDLRRVHEVDVTGARILYECTQDWAAAGKRLILAEWDATDPRRQALQAVADARARSSLHFEEQADRALERAEDELLAQLGTVPSGAQALQLQATALARGLDAEEIACLQAATTEVRFRQGEWLFRRGEAGDAIYLSLAGDIGLHVPGGTRRLASLAPGVSLGEIAVLGQGHRTVDAIAETEVVALRLPAAALVLWQAERPQLAAKLLHNIALQLADRLHLLTGDLALWMARAGAVQRPASPSLPPEGSGADDPRAWPGEA
ncbi:SulP family inorganic anion transporter [Rubrivivax rivuli]|uniref:Cyclic nucleotide-binding domain-containing protein n=1 Tax=Rubrivivax rivuli TaxID=1862385 RepID=A0A437RCJ9_9BURK|nr:SulP family inorganic anion transporter [Rubrivivax rivuli]RVU44510.1 cyclic nucleotide-binding domain-containing protein [Rubrivivax rivuli]